MKKLIRMHQENIVNCDKPGCDFKVPNPTGDPNEPNLKYVGERCPECGSVLLTMQDYLQYRNMLRTMNWLNKWFSWLTIFIPTKAYNTLYVKAHNGIHITEEKPGNFIPNGDAIDNIFTEQVKEEQRRMAAEKAIAKDDKNQTLYVGVWILLAVIWVILVSKGISIRL